jgi:hypothetical protein
MSQALQLLRLLANVLILCQMLHAVPQNALAQKLYGAWYSYPEGNPANPAMQHQFRHNSVSGADELALSRICIVDGKPVTAKVVSPIEITEDTIRVLKSASDIQHGKGASSCQISIEAGVLSYTLSDEDDRLTLTNPGGNPDLVDLSRQEIATDATPAQSLYGSWVLAPLKSKEMQMQMRYVFYTTADHHDKLREIAVCSNGHDSTVANVDTVITVTKDRVNILETETQQQQEGDFVCKVTINAGTWRYTLGAGGLTLNVIMSGDKPTTLTRESSSEIN